MFAGLINLIVGVVAFIALLQLFSIAKRLRELVVMKQVELKIDDRVLHSLAQNGTWPEDGTHIPKAGVRSF